MTKTVQNEAKICRNVLKTSNNESKVNSLFLQKCHAISNFSDLKWSRRARSQRKKHQKRSEIDQRCK